MTAEFSSTNPSREGEPRHDEIGSQGRQLDLPGTARTSKRAAKGRASLNRSGPVLVEDLKAEAGIGLETLKRVEKAHPGDPLRQVDEFFARFGVPAGTGRKREAAIKTKEAYIARLRRSVKVLAMLNMRLQNLSELSRKHVVTLTQHWEEIGRSASHLNNHNTALRRFGCWMGKPNLAPRVTELLRDPDRARRQYAAIEPKGISAKGINDAELFQAMDAVSVLGGLQLRVMLAFGLRVEELVMLPPFDADRGVELFVEKGTKGGRSRFIPIDTAYKRDLIDKAKVVASGNQKRLFTDKPKRTLKQAKRHFRSLAEKIGLTKKGLGVTLHGLRHEFANRRFKQISGVDSPVNGGPALDRATDREARLVVVEELGHSDEYKAGAYLGRRVTLAKVERQNLERVMNRVQADTALKDALTSADVTALSLVGPAARGKPLQGLLVVAWATRTGELSPSDGMHVTASLSACLGFPVMLCKSGSVGISGLPTFEFY